MPAARGAPIPIVERAPPRTRRGILSVRRFAFVRDRLRGLAAFKMPGLRPWEVFATDILVRHVAAAELCGLQISGDGGAPQEPRRSQQPLGACAS